MKRNSHDGGCAAVALAVVGLLGGAVQAQAPRLLPQGEQSGIYIGGLKIQPSVIEAAKKSGKHLQLKRTAQALDSQFISALSAARVFQIVERKRKSELEEEQGFAATAVDPNDKDAAQTGKMAGAKFAFLPQIDGFEDLVDVKNFKAIGRASMRRRVFLSATVSIVDTSTGRVLPDVPTAQMFQEEIVENSSTGTGLQGSDAALVELAKKVAASLCQDAIAILRPAKVLAITGQQILINRGAPSGFVEGMTVEFFATEEVKDEDSGETFRNEVPVGKGVITRADPKQSYAKIDGANFGVTKGCVVKLIRPKLAADAIPVSAPGGSLPEDPRRVPRQPAPDTPGSSEKPLKFDSDAEAPTVAPGEAPMDTNTDAPQDPLPPPPAQTPQTPPPAQAPQDPLPPPPPN